MHKKFLWIAFWGVLLICLLLAYFFKPMTMNDLYDKPNFYGVVQEVTEHAILVSVAEDQKEFMSSDKIMVSLDVQLKDSMTDFIVGDSVRVFYDGQIAESYPAQVHTVYAILLKNDEDTH